MNREDIIRMAQEACGDPAWDGGVDWVWGEVERFAKLVAAAEREECAKIAFNAKTYMQAAHEIRERGAP